MKKATIAALALCGVVGISVFCGCKTGLGLGGAGGGGGGHSPDEQAADDALNQADPQEVALKAAAAEVAADACSNLVQQQVPDPSTVDDATLAELYTQEAPMADAEAQAWMASVDPFTLPQSGGAYPKYECIEAPYLCKPHEHCPVGDGATCVVTGCGTGKCPWCPDAWGNLIYDGYCAYACMQGSKVWGYGINLRTRFSKKWTGFFCAPFPK